MNGNNQSSAIDRIISEINTHHPIERARMAAKIACRHRTDLSLTVMAEGNGCVEIEADMITKALSTYE
ncbi:hypothetical protein GCM10023156_29600 [Novipirellula rosea]|uniref:Uncharacterized protein n=1 Tax=Novipirellula rosea TaxID=1031540 RepID=A0ABP8MWU4_9BACT